jgi:hypothetical protein
VLAICLLIGVGIFYLGATGSCGCPEQTVGQPAPFNQFQAEVDAGLVIILISAIGLVFSFFEKITKWNSTSDHLTDGTEPTLGFCLIDG